MAGLAVFWPHTPRHAQISFLLRVRHSVRLDSRLCCAARQIANLAFLPAAVKVQVLVSAVVCAVVYRLSLVFKWSG